VGSQQWFMQVKREIGITGTRGFQASLIFRDLVSVCNFLQILYTSHSYGIN